MYYLELSPVRAEMVASVLDYPWSSARAHAGTEVAPDWLDAKGWTAHYSTERWREVLGLGFRLSGDLDRLREATRTGRPLGAPDFVAELEEKLERTLTPCKRGPKSAKAKPTASAAPGGAPTEAIRIGG